MAKFDESRHYDDWVDKAAESITYPEGDKECTIILKKSLKFE